MNATQQTLLDNHTKLAKEIKEYAEKIEKWPLDSKKSGENTLNSKREQLLQIQLEMLNVGFDFKMHDLPEHWIPIIPYTHDDINEKALYVLKVDSKGKFQTEYLPIPIDTDLYENRNDLQKNIDEIMAENLNEQDKYDKKKQIICDYWENIKKNHSDLLGNRDYCSSISSKYIHSPGISKDFKMEFLPFSENPDIQIKKDDAGSTTTIEELFSDDFFHSYFIEHAYSKCKKDKKNIKAYSHQKLGWQSYCFILNNIFSVEIKTNFGFGFASYFCVTLIYEDVKIIPYSRLVMYYKANFMELIRNTWTFDIQNDSWGLAFDKVREACNTYQDEKNSFVTKYFVNELEKLTSMLTEYLDATEFELSENEYGYYRKEEKKKIVKLSEFPLIIFRGEKISGAVGFVESIKRINKITPIQKYIDIIIVCCQKVLIQLNRAIEELKPIIEELKNEWYKIKNEFQQREKTFEEQQEKFTEITDNLNTHNGYLSKISEYKENINSFICFSQCNISDSTVLRIGLPLYVE